MQKKGIVLALGILMLALCGLMVVSMVLTYSKFPIKLSLDKSSFISINDPVESQTLTEEKKVQLTGPADITLKNLAGNVLIKNGQSNEVRIKMVRTGYGNSIDTATRNLEKSAPVIQQEGNVLKISHAVETGILTAGVNSSFEVDYEIWVPEHSKVGIQIDHGELSINGKYSDVNLQSEFGMVNANQVKSDTLIIESTNGNMNLDDIVVNKHISLGSVFGQADVVGIQSQAFSAQLENGMLNITRANIKNELRVECSFGDINLKNVKAAKYDLNSQNGNVFSDYVTGTTRVVSSFGTIELSGQDAVLTIQSQNGRVSYSGSLGEGEHNITNEFGDVNVALPETSQVKLNLDTEFGEINVKGLSVELNGKVTGNLTDNHFEGILGKGTGGILTIKNSNGSIELTKLSH